MTDKQRDKRREGPAGLQSLGQAALEVAHDFNNLLTIILGRTQFALRRAQDAEMRGDLEAIERAARDGVEVVGRIRSMAHSREKEVRLEETDIAQIVQEVAVIARRRWEERFRPKGIVVSVATELEQSGKARVSTAELREVLVNLAFNALDAMPQGGKLTLSTGEAAHRLWIKVTDTGIGIPESIKDRIFDPFFTTKGPHSSGLGLSISSAIVRKYGGTLTVESVMGQGTTFTIELPLAEEALGEPLERGRRILVVDDRAEVVDILERILAGAHYQVRATTSGREGIELFRQEPFDLVLTNLGMPEVTGWDVVRAAKEIRPEVPVLLVTGWDTALDDRELEDRGVTRMVRKPFDIAQLLRVVQRVLEERESHGIQERG